ncbi:MAG: hypothetical protein Q9166_003565 [cf. Caloplaca sp. 2 TL-2023]
MQTLWARVAQSRGSCNYSSGFSSAAAINRRTASAPIRRRLGLDDICAAFFSTVAFASAVADSNRKAAKKEEWTKVIGEAKCHLIALKTEQERHISTLRQTTPPIISIDSEESGSKAEGQTWQDVLNWDQGEIYERKALGFEDWQGIPLSVLRNASGVQIWDFLKYHAHHFPRFKGVNGPEVWNTVTWPLHIKKLKTLEWSIARLALDLMSHTSRDHPWCFPLDQGTAEVVMSELSVVTTNEIHSRRDYILSQLYTLEHTKECAEYYHNFESPTLPRYCASRAQDPDGADQLNANLHALFEIRSHRDSADISQLLPKICYYLLTSDSPPSIHTYNLLMSEFAGAGRDDLIPCLLASMYRSHMRPNEVTLAETLRHYIRTRDCPRFDRHVQRMDGFDVGIAEAHPHLDIPELLKFRYRARVVRCDSEEQFVYEYHHYSDLTESDIVALKQEAKLKVYEKPRYNLEVHHALIQGALVFHGTSEGIKHYRTMIDEGWEPDQEILLSILHHCTVDLDWEAGISVWRRLQTLTTPIEDRGFVLMLQLCQECNKYDIVQEILHIGVRQGVLPPTLMEMDWREPELHEQVLDPAKALDVAKDICILKQGLQGLLQESRAGGDDSRGISDRIKLIANQIERSLRRPTLQTVALLHEAHVDYTGEQPSTEIDTILRNSDRDILALVNELQDVQFCISVGKLQTQVHTELSTFTRWLQKSESNAFSIRLSILEDQFQGISTAATRFMEKSRTWLIRINTWILLVKFHALHKQMGDVQKEVSQFVVPYLVGIVQTMQTRGGDVSSMIHATSRQIQEIIDKINGSMVILKNAGVTRMLSSREKYRLKVSARYQRLSKGSPSKKAPRIGELPSKVNDADMKEPKARNIDELQNQLPFQSQGRWELQSRLARIFQNAPEPLLSEQEAVADVCKMAKKRSQGWRDAPSGLDLTQSRSSPLSAHELDHA